MMTGRPAPRGASLWSRLVDRLDGLQRRQPFLGFPWAVLRKYLDDGGSRLAALITYYGFLSLFPRLLLGTAAVSELLRAHPELRRQLLDHLVSPELRPEAEQALASLPPSGLPLVLGLASLIFAGTGGVLALYTALNEIWDVPWRDRFGVARQYARVLVVLVLSFTGAVAAAGSAVVTDAVLELSAAERGAAAAGTAAAVFAVIAIAHKALVCRPLRMSDIWAGGLAGAVVVTVLLDTAASVLPTLVARAGPVYGSFATVVGIFTLLYMISQTLVLSVEISAVIESGLTPRGLTAAAPTDSDRRALVLLARQQERIPGQRVTTTFSPGPTGDPLSSRRPGSVPPAAQPEHHDAGAEDTDESH